MNKLNRTDHKVFDIAAKITKILIIILIIAASIMLYTKGYKNYERIKRII